MYGFESNINEVYHVILIYSSLFTPKKEKQLPP